jgi:2-C-methyl-D-erythritol 4-phosphate cytidylyltransferase/2-C-methyl-D-erythritol 2,4-cyclodiphosphate synthase
MFVTAIIVAAGRGVRFGGAGPKQLVMVAGRPILERTVRAFLEHPSVQEVVVSMPPELVGESPGYLQHSSKPLQIVAGGPRRQDSVANAFSVTSDRTDIVVIHDAVRPFVSADLITRTIAAAAETGAAVAAVAARDTVKRAEPARRQMRRDIEESVSAPAELMVAQTLPRETIFLAQTPQAFRREVLRAALALAEREAVAATDEAALAERAGHAVRLVDGEAANIKITTPDDLVIAEAIAGSGAALRHGSTVTPPVVPAIARAGTGYDLHRLVSGRRLVLGGVTLPSERGAAGHSDADVVCHAVTDAILGAACCGDIGRHFPDSDPAWKDASSLDLLARAVTLVREGGLEVGNVDVTVILERPKIRDHIDAMRSAIATAIGIDAAQVSIKAKTNEGLDAIGRGEAVAAHAIALLRARNMERP